MTVLNHPYRAEFLHALLPWLLCLLLLVPLSVRAQAELLRIELSAGIHRIEAEVAASDQERERGLMFRRELAGNAGMLFIFPSPAAYCMWMKNTLVPLSVAYLDDIGRIVNIEDMAPQTEDSHCAAQPVRFALEMRQGWFAARGLKPGTPVRGLPDLSRWK